MFQEPIEERYNDLLKQRIALKGELALMRRQVEIERAKIRAKSRFYLFLMLIIPFLFYWYNKTQHITPLEQTIVSKQNSIEDLKNELAMIKKLKKDSIHYIIQKGDMLVTLGNLFFNDPNAGYQIGIENGISSKEQQYNLKLGDTLTIHYR